MENRIILGLDISTTCTGVSVVYCDDKGIKPIVVTHLRHKVEKNISGVEALFLKCNGFLDKLEEILSSNNLLIRNDDEVKSIITDIVIEEPLISSNNKFTVATLLRYNGMIAYRVYNLLNIVPKFISSADARKYGVPSLMAARKFNKKGDVYEYKKILKAVNSDELVAFGSYPFDCAKKLILWNYVSERFPEIQWVYNKKGELKTENFDASDSLICILGLVNYEKYGETEPKVTSCETDNEKTYIKYSYDFCGQIFSKTITFE